METKKILVVLAIVLVLTIVVSSWMLGQAEQRNLVLQGMQTDDSNSQSFAVELRRPVSYATGYSVEIVRPNNGGVE